MYFRQIKKDNCVLSYALSTDPSPLQITPTGVSPQQETISVLVSNTTGNAVTCSKLTFEFSEGKDAADLTNNISTVHCSCDPGDVWTIRRDGDSPRFVVYPQGDDPVTIDQKGYLFEFSNINVNGVVGITPLKIKEWINSKDLNKETGSAAFLIGKYPYGFYFEDFHSINLDPQPDEKESTEKVPSAAVNPGETVTFNWRCSESANYTILYDNNDPVDVTGKQTWTSKPISRDTTFYLKASLQSEGQPIEHFLSATVAVMNPNLDIGNLKTTGHVWVGEDSPTVGDTTLYTKEGSPVWLNGPTIIGSYADSDNGPLMVTKHLYVGEEPRDSADYALYTQQGREVWLNGDTWVGWAGANANLHVRGEATFDADTEVGGTLSVTGALEAEETLEVGETLKATGEHIYIGEDPSEGDYALYTKDGEEVWLNGKLTVGKFGASRDVLLYGNLQINETAIGEDELKVLKALASGQLEFDLYNAYQDEYAYAGLYTYDDDRRYVFTWGEHTTVVEGRWQIHYPSSANTQNRQVSE